MTLAELGRTLPNGFHDAELNRIEVSFTGARATLYVNLDMESGLNLPHDISMYREAEIRLTGLRMFSLNAREENFNTLSGPLDVVGSFPTTLEEPMIKKVPESAPFRRRFS